MILNEAKERRAVAVATAVDLRRRGTVCGTGGQLFSVYSDPQFQQPMIVVMGQDADPVKARVVLDPNKLDPTGGTSFDWHVPSPDGERIAVPLSKGGSKDGSFYVFDVATGRQVGEAIPRV